MNQCTETIEISDDIAQYLDKHDPFQHAMGMQGKVFRDVPGRKTIQVRLGANSYFIKQHFGVGWGEIFKNLLSLKLPILSAMTEVNAIHKLVELGIATTPLVSYGVKGCNPAKLQSFIITKDLGNIVSLEDLCVNWKASPPSEKFKRQLIVAVATIARKLHENGINHRDFYICHLCLDANLLAQNQIKLYLIDLHRVLIHKKMSVNDNMKDIAALYFSSMDIGLTARDILRFKKHYLREAERPGNDFWLNVENRANKLYAKFHSDKFQQRLSVEKSAIR